MAQLTVSNLWLLYTILNDFIYILALTIGSKWGKTLGFCSRNCQHIPLQTPQFRPRHWDNVPHKTINIQINIVYVN